MFDVEGNGTSYIALSDSVDVTEVSLETAREFPGRVNIAALNGELFVASDEDRNVTRYSISDAQGWSENGKVSFQNQGLEGWQIYEISLDGTATRHVGVTGYVESWVRIR